MIDETPKSGPQNSHLSHLQKIDPRPTPIKTCSGEEREKALRYPISVSSRPTHTARIPYLNFIIMTAIKHIEFWVSDFEKAMRFYSGLFKVIRWKQVSENGFKSGDTKIYFKEDNNEVIQRSLGPRHICFQAESRTMVDEVGKYLKVQNARMIRGPLEIEGEKYSRGYYTVDFYDPDGYILEVAHSPASNKSQ